MSPIQNVAILGGTGSLGEALIPALLKRSFHVTCITRPGSQASSALPAEVSIKTAGYADVAALTAALEGQDALVEAFNPAASVHQIPILQAALDAGVQHIITPDFSGDTFNPNIHEVLLFDKKLKAKAELEAFIAASGGRLAWTAIIVGPWYDWVIQKGFFWINKEKRTINRYGTGNQRISMSKRALNGEALVAVLGNPENFRNRPAYFASQTVSTNELISIIKDISKDDWTIIDIPLDDYAREARRMWDEDTANGVENRLATKAYERLAMVAMMEESNRYGCDFGERAEPGWDEGKDALRENLKELLI